MGRSRLPYELDFPGPFCSDLRVEITQFVVNQLQYPEMASHFVESIFLLKNVHADPAIL